ncbi:DUF4286 family protein [Paraflavisolibacter sp. H34]|uniref:DUF4286 family protein n=1 Tax=Huijunlia imazamoxiresistens TaxID=3127457 RepID=UPI003016A8A0
MLLYNVTVKVQEEIAEDWQRWQLTEHGPEMVATGCFTRFSLLRLLEVDDEEGPTFAVQYFADSLAQYERFLEEFMDSLSQKAYAKWGQRFIAFRTIMEVVH